jgi:soluble P-type ATPase
VNKVGYKNIRTSDISGKVLDDDQVVTVVVRSVGKLFDALPEELEGLKRMNNVVEIELRHADGKTEEFIVSKADFDKVVTPEVLAVADNIRGRRNGFKPNGD